MGLLLTQVALLAAAGATLGTTAALLGLTATGSPLPGIQFSSAVTVAATLTATIAALAPAAAAARRDPLHLHELRVP